MPIFNFKSLPSIFHPKINEDAFFVDEVNLTAGVFDGIGGQVAGEVASQLAAKVIQRELAKIKTEKEAVKIVTEAFNLANQTIKSKIAKNPQYAGMGTTGSIIKILNNKLIVGNVGDSRIYLKRKNQSLKQLTIDDSYVQQLVDAGEITKEQASIHPYRNIITNALGEGFRKPRIEIFEIKKNNLILLCSDGIHDNLIDKDIEKCLIRKNPAENLVEIAFKISQKNTIRSKPDDITAVVIKI